MSTIQFSVPSEVASRPDYTSPDTARLFLDGAADPKRDDHTRSYLLHQVLSMCDYGRAHKKVYEFSVW